jgi:6-phosphofructokinase 1
MQERGYDTIFVIGGNGGNAAAAQLHDAIQSQNLAMQVIGLPKSIDNDIDMIDKCFGFDTAVHEARKVLEIARNEADAVYRGVCIVKVMGRESGFIAHHAAMADVTLIPEVPLDIDIVVEKVGNVLTGGKSCVVCVAEGFPLSSVSICDAISKVSPYVKYIDPSYILRGGICIPEDSEFCKRLGVAAVDAALQGHSGVTVATKKGEMWLFPTKEIVQRPKRVQLPMLT